MLSFLRRIILHFKIFKIRHPYFLLYIICVIIMTPYIYFKGFNDFFEYFSQNQNIENNTTIQNNIETNNLESKNLKNIEKKIRFYDTNNPLVGALVFLLIECCCFYLK